MELKLKEKFVLLALNDEKGGAERGMQNGGMGLVGCILLDLVLDDIIEMRDKKVKLKSSSYSSDKVHTDVLKRIRKSKREHSLKYWISSLNMRADGYKKTIIQQLVYARILRKEGKRFLGIPYNRYPTMDPKPEKEFRNGLLDALKHLSDIGPADMALLSILEATGSMAVLVPDRAQRKQISKELKEIVKNNPFGKAVKDAVDEMTAAIVATIVTSTAATAAIS